MKLVLSIVLVSFCLPLLSQESGLPYYRVYEPNEYQGHRQNWAIAQDSSGIMYFGNGRGLLIFNGVQWHLATLPNDDHIRSLDVGHGRIYIGGHNEIGYFEKSRGTYQYSSLVEHVPDSLRNFDRVWTTLIHGENIYYQTDTFVLRISPRAPAKLWPYLDSHAWKLLELEGELLLDVPKLGLHRLNVNDEFELIPKGEELKQVGFEFILRTEQGLMFEKRDTLRIFDGTSFSTFKNEAADVFLEYGLDKGLMTQDGNLVFSTRKKGGVVVLDQRGNLIHHFNADYGFSDEVIRNLLEDSEGSIWFGLDSGISRLDLSSPLLYYDENMGLNGSVQDIMRFGGQLFVGGTDGLKRLVGGEFHRVNEINALVMDLDTIQDHLIIASSLDNLFALDEQGQLTSINDDMTGNMGINLKVQPLIEDPSSFAILYQEGIFQVKWNGKNWKVVRELKSGFLDAEDIYQHEPGSLWVTTSVAGLFKVSYDFDENGFLDLEHAVVNNLRESEGVTSGVNSIFSVGEQLFLISPNGDLSQYKSSSKGFRKDSSFVQMLGKDYTDLSLLSNSEPGSIWFEARDKDKYYLLHVKKSGVDLISRSYPLNINATSFGDPYGSLAFSAAEREVYFGGIKGMIEYKLPSVDEESNPVRIAITQINTSDSTYFDVPDEFSLNDLPHNNKILKFSYTSTNFKDAENKKFQYQLIGYENKWSEVSLDHTKEYSQLPPGSYTFKVRSLNDYNRHSPSASISFVISKPWYWNSYSIIFYVILIGILTYLFGQWRSRTLRRRNLDLQRAIDAAVEETKRQADEIAELYKVKNQFFSNISHELRTPLTLILGPSSDLVNDEDLSSKQRKTLSFINNNARRLLRLINQLLDLSKLEAGKLDIRVSQQDIVQFVATLTKAFDSLAQSRQIRLLFESPEEQLYVFYDSDKLEQVIINLLSNALKFTKEGGRVKVTVLRSDTNCLISVEDTGIGINKEQLPYIFDRFFQADNRESREHEGTGIGLSLTKELVELHGGNIQVESEYGKGSIFKIYLPLGSEHFKDHQIHKLGHVEKPITASEEIQFANNMDIDISGDKDMVLLVEDNLEMRSYIKDLIDNQYDVLEASDGLKGLEMAINHVPDLIISDVMMPKMDGTELCKKIKNNEITSHIPVILLTAKASEEDKIRGLQIDADEYLAKPFNKVELQARIENLIRTRKKLQKRFAKSTLISPKEIAVSSMEELFLEKLIEQIEQNLSDEDFSVEQLAGAMHLSRSQLHRKMISIVNQPPSTFIRRYRLELAKQLLEKGAGRVSDIAFEVGFSSPSYFTKCFVEEFGFPPKKVSK